MSDPNLITSYTFQGQPFLVKMNIINSCLELVLTDKQSGEEWECSYDSSYIENLTRKTGNYKQFDIFTAMLKSGLLKTSESITLDLLTYEDLEGMRMRRMRNYSSTRLLHNNNNHNNNRRYLIVTYSVEFDRINYPLPLEYCGPPDPVILQATIRRLEAELQTAYEEINLRSNSSEKQKVKILQKRVDDLTTENLRLAEEVKQLTKNVSKNSNGQVHSFQKAITQIERNLVSERKSHHRLLQKLQIEKSYLLTQLEKSKGSEKSLKVKLQQALSRCPSSTDKRNYNVRQLSASKSCEPNINTIYLRKQSPSIRKTNKGIQAQTQRSRSASPRITCEDFDNISENMSHRSHSRSRSSSVSLKKPQGRVPEYIGFSPNMTPKGSPRHSRKPSPQSGRSSIKSYGSDVQRNRFKKHDLPSRSQSPIIHLQRRVNKMFQNQNANKKYIK